MNICCLTCKVELLILPIATESKAITSMAHKGMAKPTSLKDFYTRCCHYAERKGRPCANPCKTINPKETMEARTPKGCASVATWASRIDNGDMAA